MGKKVLAVAEVGEVIPLAKNTVRIHLRCPEIAENVLPGQFVSIKPKDNSFTLRRPFTIWFSNHGVIQLVIQNVGPNTEYYTSLRTGQKVSVFGPLGQPVSINSGAKCVIMVAGGVGLAGLYYPTWQAVNRPNNTRVIVAAGFKNETYVFGVPDFESQPGVEISTITDDIGTAVDLFRNIIGEDDLSNRNEIQVLTCGPEVMMQQVAALSRDEGMACLVSLERMMGCGTGDCKGCAVSVPGSDFSRHVCKDGPWSDAREIWNES